MRVFRRVGRTVLVLIVLGGLVPAAHAQDDGTAAAPADDRVESLPASGGDPLQTILAALAGLAVDAFGEAAFDPDLFPSVAFRELGSVSWYVSNGEFLRLEPRDPIDVAAAGASGAAAPPRFPSGWILAVGRYPIDGAAAPAEWTVLYRDRTPVGGELLAYDRNRRVRSRTRVDGEGAVVLRESMQYRADGTIRSVQHCSGGECLTARFAPPGTAGDESIIGGDLMILLRFDPTLRPTYIRTDRGDRTEELFYRYEAGALVELRTVEGESTVIERYREGRVVTREERAGGRRVLLVESTWTDDGRLSERIERRRNRVDRETWEYRGDTTVYRRYEHGVLTLQETREGEIRVRTVYRDGSPLVRERLVDGELTEQTFFDAGAEEREEPR